MVFHRRLPPVSTLLNGGSWHSAIRVATAVGYPLVAFYDPLGDHFK